MSAADAADAGLKVQAVGAFVKEPLKLTVQVVVAEAPIVIFPA